MSEYTTDSGLRITIVKAGSGPAVEQSSTVTVNYTGWLEDGTAFDSNVDPAFGHVEPFTLRGIRGVIAGWQEGLLGMQAGEVRKLWIPSDLAYGKRGAPGAIPPDANLVFEIELVDLR